MTAGYVIDTIMFLPVGAAMDRLGRFDPVFGLCGIWLLLSLVAVDHPNPFPVLLGFQTQFLQFNLALRVLLSVGQDESMTDCWLTSKIR